MTTKGSLRAYLAGSQVYRMLVVLFYRSTDIPREVVYHVRATSVTEAGSKAVTLATKEYRDLDFVCVKRPLTPAEEKKYISCPV